MGKFNTTDQEDSSPAGIVCVYCGKRLSVFDRATDKHTPSPEALLSSGAVPVPNFGWFCSQECGQSYESEYGVRFQRNADGLINYYETG